MSLLIHSCCHYNSLPLVFKILSIKDDGFAENTNLRVSKHSKAVNLSYSAADVTWHPSDGMTIT